MTVEKEYKFEVCRSETGAYFLYLNDYRIGGGKPCGSTEVVKAWDVEEQDLFDAMKARADLKPPSIEPVPGLEEAINNPSKNPSHMMYYARRFPDSDEAKVLKAARRYADLVKRGV